MSPPPRSLNLRFFSEDSLGNQHSSGWIKHSQTVWLKVHVQEFCRKRECSSEPVYLLISPLAAIFACLFSLCRSEAQLHALLCPAAAFKYQLTVLPHLQQMTFKPFNWSSTTRLYSSCNGSYSTMWGHRVIAIATNNATKTASQQLKLPVHNAHFSAVALLALSLSLGLHVLCSTWQHLCFSCMQLAVISKEHPFYHKESARSFLICSLIWQHLHFCFARKCQAKSEWSTILSWQRVNDLYSVVQKLHSLVANSCF